MTVNVSSFQRLKSLLSRPLIESFPWLLDSENVVQNWRYIFLRKLIENKRLHRAYKIYFATQFATDLKIEVSSWQRPLKNWRTIFSRHFSEHWMGERNKRERKPRFSNRPAWTEIFEWIKKWWKKITNKLLHLLHGQGATFKKNLHPPLYRVTSTKPDQFLFVVARGYQVSAFAWRGRLEWREKKVSDHLELRRRPRCSPTALRYTI